jgi:hypothetical protein
VVRRKKKTPTVVNNETSNFQTLQIDVNMCTIDPEHHSARKSQTIDANRFNALNRSILNVNGSRNPSIFEAPDKKSPVRNSTTVQFGKQFSKRNSIRPANKLSGSQRVSFIKKVRNSVARKDSVFYIQDEDKIFDDEKFKTSVEWMRSTKHKPLSKFNNTEGEFKYIYKINHEGFLRIKKAQKMKNLDLEKYQKSLVNSIGDYLSKESIRKLEARLNDVKKMANKVQKEEAIDSLFLKINEENEISMKNLQDFMDKLNSIREMVKLGGEKLPLIKYKN